MSLFGDFDDPPPSRAKSSLFDDEPAPNGNSSNISSSQVKTTTASSSIFSDETTDATSDSSPWGFTPRKNAARGNLVKSLLANADVPELYIDEFDHWQTAGSIGAQEAGRLIKGCGLNAVTQSKIWTLVAGTEGASSVRLSRSEFSVLLALIGLAQEGEELSLDAVDERRRRLPIPALPTPAPASRRQEAPPPAVTRQESNNTAPPSSSSFGAGFETDPWGSPSAHKNHTHSTGPGSGQRTTSGITTGAGELGGDSSTHADHSTTVPSTSNDAGGWGSSHSAPGANGGFGNPGSSGEGFGDDRPAANVPRPTAPPRASTSKGAEEVVTVSILDEKEGMFMFQHRNYEVASVRRNSRVIRRYSDFVWLLDCLHKRYPFRQLPLLPPKRMQINGNHLAADSTFIEKRKRGLTRFVNALVRHPVLREEQLVVMFLTVPTELSVWRKQATISVQEEFAGKPLPPTLEDSLPHNLLDTFDTVRSGVRRSADLYITLCTLVERLCKRKEALAAEYARLNLNLISASESSNDTYAIDTNDVPLLNEGIQGTAKHVATSQALLEDEARAWDLGVLEDFKAMRDSLVGMREMFDRRERFARDNIPQLERRIVQNETKLQGIKAKGELAKPGEAEKVENAILADKQSIVDQHARGVFIKECVRDELLYFQASQYRISRLHQEWAQERVKYSELQADNFRGLVDAVESMPLGD